MWINYEATESVWTHSKATGSAHHVLLALAKFANNDFKTWPSVATIKDATGIGTTAINDALKCLQALGEITKGRDKNHNGNVYTINLPRIEREAKTAPATPKASAQVHDIGEHKSNDKLAMFKDLVAAKKAA